MMTKIVPFTITLVLSFVFMHNPSVDDLKFDFGKNKIGNGWWVMNDGVMGGLSRGAASLTENSLILKGEISLANNGGFSSVRGPWGKTDLSAYSTVTIRYRSKGQIVALCLEKSRRWWEPFYMLDLDPTDGEWKTVSLKLDNAKEYAYARPSGDKLSKEQRKEILRLGFMTNQKKESAFTFEVSYMKFTEE